RFRDLAGSRSDGDPELGSLPPRGGYQTACHGNIMPRLLFRSTAWRRSGRWKRSPVRVNTQKANSARRRGPSLGRLGLGATLYEHLTLTGGFDGQRARDNLT